MISDEQYGKRNREGQQTETLIGQEQHGDHEGEADESARCGCGPGGTSDQQQYRQYTNHGKSPRG